MTKTQYNVRFEQRHRDMLDKMAEEQDTTPAEVLRSAIRSEYLRSVCICGHTRNHHMIHGQGDACAMCDCEQFRRDLF